MNFFCTKKHYDDWVGNPRMSTDEVFCLELGEAVDVARMLFGE